MPDMKKTAATPPPAAPDLLSYEAAYAELQQILVELQSDAVGLDDLAARISRANTLIRYCRERLRTITSEIEQLS